MKRFILTIEPHDKSYSEKTLSDYASKTAAKLNFALWFASHGMDHTIRLYDYCACKRDVPILSNEEN